MYSGNICFTSSCLRSRHYMGLEYLNGWCLKDRLQNCYQCSRSWTTITNEPLSQMFSRKVTFSLFKNIHSIAKWNRTIPRCLTMFYTTIQFLFTVLGLVFVFIFVHFVKFLYFTYICELLSKVTIFNDWCECVYLVIT